MYEKKIKEDLDCGIVLAMKVFGAKWKPCIISAIGAGTSRPSEIHRFITGTTPRVVDMQLKELADWGVVYKKIQTGYPLYVQYALTELGESILPILEQLNNWGNKNKIHILERYQAIQGDITITSATEPAVRKTAVPACS